MFFCKATLSIVKSAIKVPRIIIIIIIITLAMIPFQPVPTIVCTMLSGYSLFGRPTFIPVKAAQWRMKPKWLDFPGLKIPRSEDHWAHRASALETLSLLRLCVI